MKLSKSLYGLVLLLMPYWVFGQITIKGEVVHKKQKVENANIGVGDNQITTDSSGRFEIGIDSLGQTIQVLSFSYKYKKVTVNNTDFLQIKLRKGLFKRRSRRRVCGFCFIAGTEILMADNSRKNIEKIRQGDIILSVNLQDTTLHKDTVVKIDSVLHANIIELKLENGLAIQSTKDHPYLIEDKGWCSYAPQETLDNYGIEVQQLTIGDQCLLYAAGMLTKTAITTVISVNGTMMTYNISELSKNHNYFANGILVSNENNGTTKNKKSTVANRL